MIVPTVSCSVSTSSNWSGPVVMRANGVWALSIFFS